MNNDPTVIENPMAQITDNIGYQTDQIVELIDSLIERLDRYSTKCEPEKDTPENEGKIEVRSAFYLRLETHLDRLKYLTEKLKKIHETIEL